MSKPPPLDGLPASTLQLPDGPWHTVLDCLCARFPAIDPAIWRERMQNGRVLGADGAPLPSDHPYRRGMVVHYYREVPQEPVVSGEARILHHDAHLLVADKPHGLPVQPAGAYVRQTLLTQLIRQLGNPDLAPLHRIDRDTAGLVMFSTRPDTRAAYQALFRTHRIDKGYEAWAPALPALHFPLTYLSRIEAGKPFPRMGEVAGVTNAETRIEVLELRRMHWRYALWPLTGRKHQLRVQMAALGAPLLGDTLYGTASAPCPLQLLAKSLRFSDPLDGAERCFQSGLTLAGPAWQDANPSERGPDAAAFKQEEIP